MAVNSLLKNITLLSDDLSPREYEQFSTMKKMIYVIQKLILCDYVTMFAGTLKQSRNSTRYDVAAPLLLRTYRNTLIEKANAITKNDFNTGKYIQYYQSMISLCKGTMPHADDLVDIFMDSICSDDHRLQLPKEFLLPFIFTINGTTIDKSRLPTNTDPDTDSYEFYNPIFYIPSFQISKDTGLAMVLTIDYDLQLPSFSLNNFPELFSNLPLPYRYLAGMDWKGKTMTQICGVLERFSIEHDSHVMQNDGVCTVCDLCYDIVTHSCYCRDCTPSNINAFISFCKYICEAWNVQVDDVAYLGELLKYSTINQDVVNYLLKSTDQITVAEMEAFKSSIFSTFIHKTVSATEASNPDAETDDDENDDTKKEDMDAQAGTTETPNTITNTDAPADTDTDTTDTTGDITDMDTGLGDIGGDTDDDSKDDTEEEQDTPTKKVERKIPPAADGILLELLNPENEQLPDHLYRKEFLRKVNDLLHSTSTKKYSSQTLFMLKRWATSWLYVFSVASLKSFLRNINCSIMAKQ